VLTKLKAAVLWRYADT